MIERLFEHIDFIRESNKIEGIVRSPSAAETEEFYRFINLKKITIKDLEIFVSIYAPGNRLRNSTSLNVSIGGHLAPRGGLAVVTELESILSNIEKCNTWENIYHNHQAYELLHPFTDGNGRSGRMLWMWEMQKAPLGFLHTYYYQSLSAARGK